MIKLRQKVFALVFALALALSMPGGMVLAEEAAAGQGAATSEAAGDSGVPVEAGAGEESPDAAPQPDGKDSATPESEPEETAGQSTEESAAGEEAPAEDPATAGEEAPEEELSAADGEAEDAEEPVNEATIEEDTEALGYMPGEMIVVVKGTPDEAEVLATANGAEEAEMAFEQSGEVTLLVEVPESQTVAEAVAQMNEAPGVVYAQPNFLYYALETADEPVNGSIEAAGEGEDVLLLPQYAFSDPLASGAAPAQWHLKAVNASAAWDIVKEKTGTRVKVGVLDVLFDFDHVDFTNVDKKFQANDYFYKSDGSLSGWIPVTSPTEVYGHGTHVAGIIAAAEGNGLGGVGVGAGVGNTCISLVPANVFAWPSAASKSRGDEPSASTLALVSAINAMADYGVKVINMSLGGKTAVTQSYSDTLLDTAMRQARDKGCVCICAAGNEKTNARYYPSDSPYAISVTALKQNSGSYVFDDSYSNYGADKDVAAPGSNIYSTLPGNTYNRMSGTSMATPVVSGVAALLYYVNPGLAAADVEGILCATATDLGAPGRDDLYGWGMVDAEKAVKSAFTRVTGVTLPATAKLSEGASTFLSPTVLPANAGIKRVWWSSSDAAVAAVDSYGNVTAGTKGTAVLTCTTADGAFQAACTVAVVRPVTGVSLGMAEKTVKRGGSYQMPASVLPAGASNTAVTWSTASPSIAAVDAAGVVRGMAAGTTTLTCTTAEGGKTASVKITVGTPLTKFTLNMQAKTVTKGSTYQLKTVFTPKKPTNKSVTWKSSKSSVVSVTSKGRVTAKKSGKATITCTAKDGALVAKCVITVGTPVESVALSQTAATLRKGKSVTLKAGITPSNAKNKAVTWASSRPSVAKVSTKGVVKALKNGSTTITCQSKDGKKTSKCKITVK